MANTKIPTYEEYLSGLKDEALKEKQEADRQAEVVKQRSTIDAQNAFEQNKVGYGANAEALSSMGLTGGGYSDYLNSQAYAQKRSDMQVANVTESATKQQNQQTYSDYIKNINQKLADKALYDQQLADERAYNEKITAEQREYEEQQREQDRIYQEEQKEADRIYQEGLLAEEQRRQDEQAAQQTSNQMFTNLWGDIQVNSGNYTEAFIDSMAKQYGFSAEQTAALKSLLSTTQTNAKAAADKAAADEQAAKDDAIKSNYATLLGYANDGTYNADQLAELGKAFGLSDTQIQSLKDAAGLYITNKQKANYESYISISDTSGFNTIKAALSNGDITQAQYDDLVEKYQARYYDSYKYSVEADFAAVNTGDIDKAYKSGWISEAQYNDVKSKYNSEVANALSAVTIFYANGAQLDENAAKTVVNELKNTGWLTDANKTALDNALTTSYKKEEDSGGGCFAKGTLITMADGTQKAVEELKEGDLIRVFNHETGEIDVSPIMIMFYDGLKTYKVLTLEFSNGAKIDVLFGHGFLDTEERKYVILTPENIGNYIGHSFYYVEDSNGETHRSTVELVGYRLHNEETECYSVFTAIHFNHFANNLLAITDDIDGLLNIFELNSDFAYDKAKKDEDIKKYGEFSYDEWKDYITEEQFIAFSGPYIKTSIGKGITTIEEIIGYIKRYV